MKSKLLFFGLFITLLLIGIISGAMTSGIFSITTGGDKILISTICQESWTGFWTTTCSGGSQTFICSDSNNCGTENLKPVLCGTARACTVELAGSPPSGGGTPSGGGGGGGGGPSGGGSGSSGGGGSSNSSSTTKTCTEKWECGNWSNSEKECGIRNCTDVNNCGTILLRPATTKECSNSFLTGSTIKGFTNFAKSTPGIISITLIVVVLVSVIVVSSKNRTKRILESKGENPKAEKSRSENKNS